MPDPRFYESLRPATLDELVRLTAGRLAGDVTPPASISGVATLSRAGPEDITFAVDHHHSAALAATRAGACFLPEPLAAAAPAGCAAVIVGAPQAAWARASLRLIRPRPDGAGAAMIASTAILEPEVEAAPGVFIGEHAAIGARTTIASGAVIGQGVAIGRDCRIGANVVIGFALIGDRVNILANATIGEPGFGAAVGPAGLIDIPQLGRVILQDDVTIGAGTCVDRGAFEDTVVGENTKIDNLVQIAHNVTIGRNCVLAAHTGISGSVTIGDGCQLGGRVGVSDHLSIGAGARLAAAAGVMRDVPAGETWGGFPAKPLRRWLRETSMVGRLAEPRTPGESQAR